MLFAENKHKFFDVTEGESEHKKLLAAGHRQCADLFFIRRSFAHWLLAQGRLNVNAATKKSSAFFERNHLQTRIRQWLRFGC